MSVIGMGFLINVLVNLDLSLLKESVGGRPSLIDSRTIIFFKESSRLEWVTGNKTSDFMVHFKGIVTIFYADYFT